MTLRLFLGLCLLCVSMVEVSSEPYSDCMKQRDLKLRGIACEEVINGSEFSTQEKALAYREKGSLQAEAGAHAEALKSFDKAIKLSPKDAQVYVQRGLAQLVLGMANAAINDLSQAIKLRPNSERYLVSRGYAYLSNNNFQAAIKDFNAAIVLNPKSAVAFNNRGLAYRKMGDLDSALADYSVAIYMNPVYAIVYANRGYVYELKGKKEQAISDFKKALSLNSSIQRAQQGLIRLNVKNAREEASVLFKKGKKLVEAKCSRCHAVGKTGNSPFPKAPEFRSFLKRYKLLELREPISRGIAAPHDEMPKFDLTNNDIDAIVAYINSLAIAP